MRVSREQAAENRERIVASAAKLFRQQGFDGVGVDAIMQGAGLTHGGFYGHFRSKDDLAAEAMALALARSTQKHDRFADLHDLLSDYLSERHQADCANGCAVAALGADFVRARAAVRRPLTAYVSAQIDRLGRLLKRGSAADKRRRAIAVLSGMVGALTLARAVDDPALSKEILASAREVLAKI
jgi:TetR/AcrR family transcriptional regulator, transcriptional repressor for nem operon